MNIPEWHATESFPVIRDNDKERSHLNVDFCNEQIKKKRSRTRGWER